MKLKVPYLEVLKLTGTGCYEQNHFH